MVKCVILNQNPAGYPDLPESGYPVFKKPDSGYPEIWFSVTSGRIYSGNRISGKKALSMLKLRAKFTKAKLMEITQKPSQYFFLLIKF